MKTLIPAKITFAGENTYKKYIREYFGAYINLSVETYQTNAAGDGRGKCVQDIHSWAQPRCQSLIATARLVKVLNLILEHG